MDTIVHRSATAFLRRCARAYEAVVTRVLALEARGDDEATLRWVGLAANIAWAAHPGRFADQRLEAVGLRIGQRLQLLNAPASRSGASPPRDGARRRILHVATTIYSIGGHTRLIENWIKKDKAGEHSLMLLDQGREPIRADLAAQVGASGGRVIAIPAAQPLLAKARQLRQEAQAGYDVVVLHHHPSDVVPLVALATPDCPPVAVMNHADHVFWLGVSVADAVIDFRAYGARMSRDRRGARRSLMLPLPLDLDLPALDRTEARTTLGLSPDDVMLLTIGSAYKYQPTPTHNLFSTIYQVLDANPTTRLHVIGMNADEFRSFGIPSHDRLILLGRISDPSVHEAAADLYLEGFPLNSYTALLETAARGVCPVLMYAPTPELDLSDDAVLKGLVSSTDNEADYVKGVTALITHPAVRSRIGEEVARRIASVNGGDIGRTYLQPIYEQLQATTHQPAAAPVQDGAELQEDVNLANFNRTQNITAVLGRGVANARDRMTLADLAHAVWISVRIGDTRPAPSHLKAWVDVARGAVSVRRRKAGIPR